MVRYQKKKYSPGNSHTPLSLLTYLLFLVVIQNVDLHNDADASTTAHEEARVSENISLDESMNVACGNVTLQHRCLVDSSKNNYVFGDVFETVVASVILFVGLDIA